MQPSRREVRPKRGYQIPLRADGSRLADVAVTHCQNSRCNHRHVLDLKALADRFGPDAPAIHDDLVPRLKCMKGDGKQIELTYTPAVRPSGNPAGEGR